MAGEVLIAGIGNIFQGDDAFGVAVVQKLGAKSLPENVRVMDIGIRSVDLAFALLDEYELTILIDATPRGGAPGTLYTIEITPDDIPAENDEALMVNSHGLDPVRVLMLARSMGARFKKILLIGCEPLVVEHDETGHIGLSAEIAAAVEPAVEAVRQLLEEFTQREVSAKRLKEEEVYTHERS
jgi:hydrogenase maturation protease